MYLPWMVKPSTFTVVWPIALLTHYVTHVMSWRTIWLLARVVTLFVKTAMASALVVVRKSVLNVPRLPAMFVELSLVISA